MLAESADIGTWPKEVTSIEENTYRDSCKSRVGPDQPCGMLCRRRVMFAHAQLLNAKLTAASLISRAHLSVAPASHCVLSVFRFLSGRTGGDRSCVCVHRWVSPKDQFPREPCLWSLCGLRVVLPYAYLSVPPLLAGPWIWAPFESTGATLWTWLWSRSDCRGGWASLTSWIAVRSD